MSRNYDDIDLMQFADGEVDEATAGEIARQLQGDPDAERKVEALEQVTDTVRSYLELAADDAEPGLDAMWATIERRIHSNGESRAAAGAGAVAEAMPEPPARAPARPAEPADTDRAGLRAAITRFFDSYRGHFLTGAVAAAAAALIILAVRPADRVVVERPVAVGDTAAPQMLVNDTQAVPAKLVTEDPSPPEIEHLDVNGGSGTVFVMPKEGEDDVSATVIFVDMNTEVEGPL